MKTPLLLLSACVLLTVLSTNAAPKSEHKTWTDPESALHDDPDFAIQGEYRSAEAGMAMGAQVVVIGSGRFDVYVLNGGLPGQGWEPGMSRIMLRGGRKGELVECVDGSNKVTATINNDLLSLKSADGSNHELARIERHSPTLGTKPPEGAEKRQGKEARGKGKKRQGNTHTREKARGHTH